MARKKLQDYNKEELLTVLEQKDSEIRKLKKSIKEKDKYYKELQKRANVLSADCRKLREEADEAFSGSIERAELENKAALHWHFYQHQKAITSNYIEKYHELQVKYNLLLSRMDENSIEKFENVFQTDVDWRNCERRRIALQAENEHKEQTIQMLQDSLSTCQKELAILQRKVSENPKNAGRKALPNEIRKAIFEIRNTPKEDGSLPTIKEVASILGIGTGTVCKYLNSEK